MKLFHGKIIENQFYLMDDEAHHIQKVLRLKEGENIVVCNGAGYWANAKILYFGKKLELRHLEINYQEKTNTSTKIAIAPTKNLDRLEFFVEKATELNISEIQLLLCDHSERKIVNIEKLQKKAIAASKQSLRFHFPKIHEMMKLTDFVTICNTNNTFLAHCDENFKRMELSELSNFENICFLVGPEGDFSTKEIEIISAKNIKSISLGYQRFRTETAGIVLANWAYLKSF